MSCFDLCLWPLAPSLPSSLTLSAHNSLDAGSVIMRTCHFCPSLFRYVCPVLVADHVSRRRCKGGEGMEKVDRGKSETRRRRRREGVHLTARLSRSRLCSVCACLLACLAHCPWSSLVRDILPLAFVAADPHTHTTLLSLADSSIPFSRDLFLLSFLCSPSTPPLASVCPSPVHGRQVPVLSF